MSESVIPKSDNAIDDVWNVYNIPKGSDRRRGKFTKSFSYENERVKMISRKASRKLKKNCIKKRKLIVSLTVSNETRKKP